MMPIFNNNMDKGQKPFISFVIPMFNEEECVKEIYARIRAVNEVMGAEFEMVCVNDHSTDSTLDLLKELRKEDQRIKVVSFSRNFGHQIAVTAGLRYVAGDCVVVMDADLQDPPELVLEMVKKWKEGFKVVYGIRGKRELNILSCLCDVLFYRLLHFLSPLPIPLDAGDFCLMDKQVVKELRRLCEDGPYVRGLRAWVGFSQIGVKYDRPKREKGKPKYNYWKLFKLAVDGILSFSPLPLKISAYFGILLSILSIAYALYIVVARVMIGTTVPGWAGLMVAVTFLMGVQFLFLGIIGEYVGRIHNQVKGRPLFVVEQEIGFGKDG